MYTDSYVYTGVIIIITIIVVLLCNINNIVTLVTKRMYIIILNAYYNIRHCAIKVCATTSLTNT